MIARQLRERSRCGLIIVTGRGDAVDKVVGLEIGADDYVTKPSTARIAGPHHGDPAPHRVGGACTPGGSHGGGSA